MRRRHRRVVPLVVLTAVIAGAGCAGSGAERVSDRAEQVSDRAAGRPVLDVDAAEVLPIWATDEELAVQRNAPPPIDDPDDAAPDPGYRIPAEYEPVSTVVMTWAGHSGVLKGIAVAAAAAGADVWMVGGPPSIAGVPADSYRALSLDFDSVWSRDYGPVGINETTKKLGIVDTTYRHYASRLDDDAMSCRLAAEFDGDCHPTSLILDGGNYMTDGEGNAFLTSRVYDWNRSLPRDRVDELLRTYLGAKQIHILDYAKTPAGEPADGTGHIDMFAKLVGDCAVIVAQTANEPFKTVTDKAAAFFKGQPCGTGTYEVTRVQGWLQGATWYTYTNSLIVNETVVIPFYNDNRANRAAVRAYASAMPRYEVVGVNSESTIVVGGSIHCVTREIPAVA